MRATISFSVFILLSCLISIFVSGRTSPPSSSSSSSAFIESADVSLCEFNSQPGQCTSFDACQGSRVANVSPCGSSEVCCIPTPYIPPANGCGSDALKLASTWAEVNLKYCQTTYGQPDPDQSCSHICDRTSNHYWDDYRSDCSGFVSYCYGLKAPGNVTSEFAPFDTTFSKVLFNVSDLAPGDLINAVPREHIMIFVKWLNKEHTQAEFLEEPGKNSLLLRSHRHAFIAINRSHSYSCGYIACFRSEW